MKKIKNTILNYFAVIIGIIIVILFIPLMILALPFFYIKHITFKKRYTKYLPKIEGKNFFIYNNRKNSTLFIENNLIPHLNKDVEVIFLDGEYPKSTFSREFISHMLHDLKNYKKFPHLMKVRNGEVLDQSVNNELYNTLNQGKAIDNLIDTIHSFFELNTKLNVA